MGRYDADPREERLPVWAQQELRRMRADLGYAARRLSEKTTPDTRVFAFPHADPPVPVGVVGDSVRFISGPRKDDTDEPVHDGHYFDVQLNDEGVLLIRSSWGLAIEPAASNSVAISNVDYRGMRAARAAQ